jgi:hypothetical protein
VILNSAKSAIIEFTSLGKERKTKQLSIMFSDADGFVLSSRRSFPPRKSSATQISDMEIRDNGARQQYKDTHHPLSSRENQK